MTDEAEKTAEEELAEGTLLSHLIELRTRLLRMFMAVIAIFIILLPWADDIFSMVSEPLREVLPGGQMIATQVASPLLTPFKLTFFVALFIAMPVVLLHRGSTGRKSDSRCLFSAPASYFSISA